MSEKNKLKPLSWPHSFKGPGYALKCTQCGLSMNDWFSTEQEAIDYADKIVKTYRCTGSLRCINIIFEEDVLSDDATLAPIMTKT